MARMRYFIFIVAVLVLTGCSGPPAIAREGWTLIDVLTNSERRDFQIETVDVRNCALPIAAEQKERSCSAGSSASFSVGAQVGAGAAAGVVVANVDVSVGASTAFELGFDRSSGDTLALDTPPEGFVNRYWIQKEYRILSGQGRIQHYDGTIENGVYTLQVGCFLHIERVEILTCEAASTPIPSPTPLPPTRTPTPFPTESTATPTTESTTGGEQPVAGAVREIGGIEFVYVPAGEFSMGSDAGDSDEKPVHSVYLDSYWVMRTEVTNAQYGRFVDAGGYATERFWTTEGWKWRVENGSTLPSRWTDSDFNGAEHPVVGVSWYEAVAYAKWLSEETGLALRLPTEAEWEKAARGTDGRIYPWGNNWDGSRLNYCDVNCTNSWADKDVNDGYTYTAPVGSYASGASPYGAQDMTGNVWEWVQDWYDSGYYATSPARNPQGAASGQYRVLRGGSWNLNPAFVRAAGRVRNEPVDRNRNVGFRLVAPGL